MAVKKWTDEDNAIYLLQKAVLCRWAEYHREITKLVPHEALRVHNELAKAFEMKGNRKAPAEPTHPVAKKIWEDMICFDASRIIGKQLQTSAGSFPVNLVISVNYEQAKLYEPKPGTNWYSRRALVIMCDGKTVGEYRALVNSNPAFQDLYKEPNNALHTMLSKQEVTLQRPDGTTWDAGVADDSDEDEDCA